MEGVNIRLLVKKVDKTQLCNTAKIKSDGARTIEKLMSLCKHADFEKAPNMPKTKT